MAASESSCTVHAPETFAQLARVQLRALAALLHLEGEAPDFAPLLEAFGTLFACDRMLVVTANGARLTCIAAAPAENVGREWSVTPLLDEIIRGRVVALDADRPTDATVPIPADLVGPREPVLLLPLSVGGQRAALVLRRRAGLPGFSAWHIVLARHYAVLALALCGLRGGENARAERDELRRLNNILRADLGSGADDVLLTAIIEQLPIGVTVQDEAGQFILVNPVAAANLEMAPQSLIGQSPANFLSPEEAAQRRQWELGLMQSGEPCTIEENHVDGTGERTWLTSHRAVYVGGRAFLMSTSSDITDRKRIENELARRAYFDDLTGLPNRALVEQCVHELLLPVNRGRLALAFIDLDNFKHINDYYSHAIGDALLVKVAERINKCLRHTDMLARISGDEFVLLIAPLIDEQQVRAIIENIVAELKKPFQIEGFELFTSASVGVSVYPEHGASYEALRRNADNAMYRAKNGSKGEAIYFDTAMGQSVTARMELEQRLRLAIRDRKFCCAFQPKVDLRTQQVLGFETLVRWRDENGEIQPPSSFVDLAIELGLIDPITRFVLEEAIRSIEHLDAEFGVETTISINVAAKQAGDLTFMRSLVDAVDTSGIARRLMIELTEDAFVAKNQFQRQVLPMLRELGVRISIDDFGTGHSSLSALADITADELKVDRSFITAIHQRPRSQSVLRAIESLGTSLGMTIVAEGVETFEELAYLRAATRIRQGQGYYFSKPFFIGEMKTTDRAAALNRPAETARPSPSGRPSLTTRTAGA